MERISEQGLQEDLKFCENLAVKSAPPSCDQAATALATVQSLRQLIEEDKLAIADSNLKLDVMRGELEPPDSIPLDERVNRMKDRFSYLLTIAAEALMIAAQARQFTVALDPWTADIMSKYLTENHLAFPFLLGAIRSLTNAENQHQLLTASRDFFVGLRKAMDQYEIASGMNPGEEVQALAAVAGMAMGALDFPEYAFALASLQFFTGEGFRGANGVWNDVLDLDRLVQLDVGDQARLGDLLSRYQQHCNDLGDAQRLLSSLSGCPGFTQGSAGTGQQGNSLSRAQPARAANARQASSPRSRPSAKTTPSGAGGSFRAPGGRGGTHRSHTCFAMFAGGSVKPFPCTEAQAKLEFKLGWVHPARLRSLAPAGAPKSGSRTVAGVQPANAEGAGKTSPSSSATAASRAEAPKGVNGSTAVNDRTATGPAAASSSEKKARSSVETQEVAQIPSQPKAEAVSPSASKSYGTSETAKPTQAFNPGHSGSGSGPGHGNAAASARLMEQLNEFIGGIRSDPDGAIGALEELRRKTSKPIELSVLYMYSALAYQQKGDTDGVIENARKSIEHWSDNLTSLMLVAAMLPTAAGIGQSGPDETYEKLREAETDANTALRIVSEAPSDLSPKLPGETDDQFDKRTASMKSQLHSALGAVHQDRALVGNDKGELTKSEEEYQTAIAAFESNPVAHLGLGITYALEGKTDEAIESLTTASRLGQGTWVQQAADQQIDALKKAKQEQCAFPRTHSGTRIEYASKRKWKGEAMKPDIYTKVLLTVTLTVVIWLTAFRYERVGSVLVRTNRFSGDIEYSANGYWNRGDVPQASHPAYQRFVPVSGNVYAGDMALDTKTGQLCRTWGWAGTGPYKPYSDRPTCESLVSKYPDQ
jgi:tetratricopeptide (TPR) repeat protein